MSPRQWRAVGACVALAAAAGCTVGPDYRLPKTALVRAATANGAFVEASNPALSTVPLPPRWWRLYDDPRLDALVADALAANTDLRVADANLERSRAMLVEAKTARQPQVSFSGAVERSQLAGEAYLLPIRPPVDNYYSLGVSVSYDLDLFGGIHRGIQAAVADDEAVQAARDLAVVNVAAETTRAYVDVCGAGLQLAAARRSLELQSDSLLLTQRLLKGGRAITVDVTRSRQQVETLTGAIPQFEAAQLNALYRLATLTGRPPAEFDRTIEHCASPPRLLQPLPVGDGAGLLGRRPDVRMAERQLAAATASIGVATASLYPSIGLGASVGSTGLTSDLLKAQTNEWDFGPSISWQANQNAARARIAQASASAKLALAHFDGVVLSSLKDAETALNNYVHDLEREKSARTARDLAAKAASDIERLQKGGRATALGVLDAQRTLAAAEQTLAQFTDTVSTDQVSVFLALGGGWGEEADPDRQASTPPASGGNPGAGSSKWSGRRAAGSWHPK